MQEWFGIDWRLSIRPSGVDLNVSGTVNTAWSQCENWVPSDMRRCGYVEGPRGWGVGWGRCVTYRSTRSRWQLGFTSSPSTTLSDVEHWFIASLNRVEMGCICELRSIRFHSVRYWRDEPELVQHQCRVEEQRTLCLLFVLNLVHLAGGDTYWTWLMSFEFRCAAAYCLMFSSMANSLNKAKAICL